MDENKAPEHYANKEVFDYAMRTIGENFADMKKDLHIIKNKVDTLIGFRWMLIGGSGVVAALVSVAIAVFYGH